MKAVLLALAFRFFAATAVSALLKRGQKKKGDLKSGATLFLHEDGTSRMVDAHGKAMEMSEGEEMVSADGKSILMMNKKIWVRWGAPGKGGEVLGSVTNLVDQARHAL